MHAAPLMGKFLARENLPVDLFLVSTAERVQETVQLVRQHWGSEAALRSMDELYLASHLTIQGLLSQLEDSVDTAIVVAHNPGLQIFAQMLARQEFDLPTAAVAVFESSADGWSNCFEIDSIWTLTGFWKPRDLEAAQSLS